MENGGDVEGFIQETNLEEEAWKIANNTGVPPSLQNQESALHLVNLHHEHFGRAGDNRNRP